MTPAAAPARSRRVALGLLAAAACSGADGDLGGRPDAGARDARDLGSVDAAAGDDAGRRFPNVGARCRPHAERTGCVDGAVCLALSDQVGVCVGRGCGVDNPATSVSEDDCDTLGGGLRCVDLSEVARLPAGHPCDGEGEGSSEQPCDPARGNADCPEGERCLEDTAGAGRCLLDPWNSCLEDNFCVPACRVSDVDRGGCPDRVACSPFLGGWLGLEPPEALCLEVACTGGRDCPVFGPRACASDRECGTDEFCAAYGDLDGDGASERFCAREGRCRAENGLCVGHAAGRPGARIGDPCASDYDCPDDATCFREQGFDRDGDGVAEDVIARNGYCTARWCSYGDAVAGFRCPAGSACNRFPRWIGGYCQKICDVDDPAACRGNDYDPAANPGGDLLGDYECLPWNEIAWVGVGPGAGATVCDFSTPLWSCAFARQVSRERGCGFLGERFACVDPATGAPAELADDPAGSCLDETGSGPPRGSAVACAADRDCDDGQPCTADRCDPSGRCARLPDDAAACDDGDPCTENVCADGACALVGPVRCDDGNPCTDDACAAPDGCRHVPDPANGCDDGRPCTDDRCDPSGRCESTPVACPDADGDRCTIEGCDDASGRCGIVTTVRCPDDDDNPCTIAACVPISGECLPAALADCCGNGACEPPESALSCQVDCGI